VVSNMYTAYFIISLQPVVPAIILRAVMLFAAVQPCTFNETHSICSYRSFWPSDRWIITKKLVPCFEDTSLGLAQRTVRGEASLL
jgi:hypothetical protein